MVRRIFVEKKKGFDIEAQRLFSDLRIHLHLKQVEAVRVINRYDIEGIEEKVYESAKCTVFSEPVVDRVWEETMSLGADSFYFAVEYLPGQYDQRADSAAQCIQMLSTSTKALVRSARVYIITGHLNEEEKQAIKEYCINPVDSREASWGKPLRLELDMDVPENVERILDFTSWDTKALEEFRTERGFAMSKEDMLFIQAYYKKENTVPTITELRVIDTYWSDHCRHTTFHTKITDVQFEEGPYSEMLKEAYESYLQLRKDVYGEREKDICLMDMAVMGAKYLKKQGIVTDLDESEEINACSIKVKALIDGKEEDWLVMFKNETHNHPTEIEPFGGAATCLGGAIRDPLSGRVYVYQAMRVSGSGDPRTKIEDTLTGKLPQRKITKGAADGYSSYGNQIGLATGQVTEIYDPGYVAKRMEVGAVIGAAPASHVRRARPIPGDCIVLIGGRTGRDGCGGATGSSKEHTEDSILNCGAEVQKGNPPVERNIQRFYRRKEVATLIKRCNDFGAGGVSVAIGELADSIDVNLDLVPKKYEGLDGTELAISESQERMAAVVSKEDCEALIRYASEENLEATAVAWVTDSGYFRMFWRGECILNLSRAFLDTNGTTQNIEVKVESPCAPVFERTQKKDIEEIASDLNCCSQKGLIEQFDSTIGAGSVLMPLGGQYQLSPAAGMAAKLPITKGYTDTTSLMTFGFDPQISKKSPFHGALYAVIDSATKITAMGGDYAKARLTFQEYFERLGDDPVKWGKPFAALLGALKAQIELEIPAIGGKDSMSGTFMDIHVPPTLISFAVGMIEAGQVVSTEFKTTASKLVFVYTDRDATDVLDFAQYRKNMKTVQQLSNEKKVLAAAAVGKGGIFASVLKMAAGNKIGASLKNISKEELYASAYGSLILEIVDTEDAESLFAGSQYKEIGFTTDDSEIEIILNDSKESHKVNLDQLISAWESPLEEIFPTKAKEECEKKEVKRVSYYERNHAKPSACYAKPQVFIPAFPGTNCEMDSKRAFERAGAVGEIQIIRNRSEKDLNESIEEMAKNIRNSQIIMIPGGFSGGDEPDGSAKFITALFRNPMIQEAVEDLIENRDGLMLGICNGFQALIKLGLIPYGKIVDAAEGSPTLTYNRIGRHVSCLTRTRIASVKSPWLAFTEVGDVHTIPISHGEGRFIADEKLVKELAENGQIATQYVDLNGVPTMEPRWNPNGSVEAVCGITSPDGRIFGKMGHSERIGHNLYKNVVGEKDQKLFEAGVAYFK
ncbi:phosphoribosylformylglycinamidine synthase [Sinanaerobacter sp. ZZT-01]|uniref:phosphoribosylformylglycinamidine synthase n=1 Tax=Sinanaerobacter sp. ZZT-01 TaxID=3111540 RepID=UPI002D76CE60|nr:phosphoribosylformylglycinamidine synthase [Sinanaerobacter sp. ZZT-01]WRR94576.1 phosphoribosylformylglycinamidine synthase [Sinanaerobacter sp. ZZT-01]